MVGRSGGDGNEKEDGDGSGTDHVEEGYEGCFPDGIVESVATFSYVGEVAEEIGEIFCIVAEFEADSREEGEEDEKNPGVGCGGRDVGSRVVEPCRVLDYDRGGTTPLPMESLRMESAGRESATGS